jgi:hypothetical protein
MTPQNQTEMDTESSSSEPAHRHIQTAHERYFQDVMLAWAAVQSRFQTIQMEFERALERAWQAQDPDAYQTALAEYQGALQSASTDANQAAPYNDAYIRYKAAMQKAIAGANIDDLSFTDMAHIGQSLATVWPIAMVLSQSGAVTTSPGQ